MREAQLKGSREVAHLGLLFLAGVQGGKRFAVALQTPRAPKLPPTPVGWLKALRPHSLSAPACTLLAWGRSGSTMSGLGKKGKQAKSKSHACPRLPFVSN